MIIRPDIILPESSHPKVWATIVTLNRLEMLKECVDALRCQTRPPDRILVVDNGSEDGTEEWLNEQDEVMVIRQTNTGSAGGQFTAFKAAYENGADWIWTMDDDVFPEKGALKELLRAIKIVDTPPVLLASRVVSPCRASMNVPGISMSAPKDKYANWEEYLADGIVRIEESTFVSILIPRSTVQKAGYPQAEMFLWGDDTEFTRRCSSIGSAYLVGKSVAEHRRASAEPLNIWRERDVKRLSMYCHLYRNQAFIAKRHGQHIFRRNQMVSISTFLYCLLLLGTSLLDSFKYRRTRPLYAILSGTISGIFTNHTIQYPKS